MATQTDKFEKATLLSFWYTIDKGAPWDPIDKETYLALDKGTSPTRGDLQQEMAYGMLQEYPGMDYDKWYLGILRGSAQLSNFIGHRLGVRDVTWNYGHFGSGAGLSHVTQIKAAGDETDILDYIWNHFSTEQKAMVGRKKDSWNPSDVYMIQKSHAQSIKRNIDKLLCIGDHETQEGCLGIAAVNAYLSRLLEEQLLVGISLKQATPAAAVRLVPTNIGMDPDGLEGLSGSIDTPLKTKMEIIGFGAGNPSFDTNSLTFNAHFESGRAFIRYAYESKVSSPANHATEPRNLVENVSTQKYIKARARNGAIPAPRMAELVREYTGENINDHIPMNSRLTATDITYWKNYFRDLSAPNGLDFDFGAISVDGTQLSRENFIGQAAGIDNGNPVKGSFDIEFRSKLRLLRYYKMFGNAARRTPSELPELIAKIYFLSSKINFKQGDLAAPFIKIQ